MDSVDGGKIVYTYHLARFDTVLPENVAPAHALHTYFPLPPTAPRGPPRPPRYVPLPPTAPRGAPPVRLMGFRPRPRRGEG